MLLLIGIAAIITTYLGGLLALRFKDQLHLILGFSGGAVLGVAFFDLLPEALELGENYFNFEYILTIVAIGFGTYLLLDRLFVLFGHAKDGQDDSHEHSEHRGHLGAGSLTIHSFLDGLAIGLAFQVSSAVGAVVSVAVLIHKFSDGINTVNLSLLGSDKDLFAKRWLMAASIAPLLGIIASMFFTVKEDFLSLVIAFFAGTFFYLGASELIPESHHRHPRFWTSFTTVLGFLVMYVVIQLAGH